MGTCSYSTPAQKRYVPFEMNSSKVLLTARSQMIARHKINGAGIMKGLDFAKGGRYVPLLTPHPTSLTLPFTPPSRLATNSSDRILRQFTLPLYPPSGPILDTELEPTYRFTDPINKVAWHTMSYSPDGEWLAGGAADNAAHKIYVWDIVNEGQFAATLDGGREPLVHVHVRAFRSESLFVLSLHLDIGL